MKSIRVPYGLKRLGKSLRRLVRYRKLASPFMCEQGYCWVAPVRRLRHLADSSGSPGRSTLVVYENSIPLHRAHVPHDLIRNEGKGVYSHWGDAIFFSTTDNSDPNSNGRAYTYSTSAKVYQALGRGSSALLPVNYSRLDTTPESLAKDVAYALQVGFGMLEWVHELRPLRDKRVLELGPGINFGPILVLACHGAIPIVADRFLKPWDPEYHPTFYREFRAEMLRRYPEVDPGPIDRLLEAGSYPEDVLRRVTSGAEQLDLPSQSVDITLSNAVFEHLEDHSKAFSELFRITNPGGWGFHQVDFRDHRSFERPLEHLLLPREKFDRIAKECFRECGTCLRPFEMIKLFEDCGFEVKEFTRNYFATPDYLEDFLPRLRKSRRSPYRGLSEEQLQVLSGFFIVRKP